MSHQADAPAAQLSEDLEETPDHEKATVAKLEEAAATYLKAADRARELRVIERLLKRAADDPEWRQATEAALRAGGTPLGKQYSGGSRVSDVWGGNTLIHMRVARALQEDPAALLQFARTCPALADMDAEEPDLGAYEQLPPDHKALAAYIVYPTDDEKRAEALNQLCDVIEQESASQQTPGVALAEESAQPLPASADEVRELESRVAESQALVRARDREVSTLRSQLDERVRQVSQRDRRNHALREELKQLSEQRDSAQAAAQAAQAEADRQRRLAEKLKGQAQSSRDGIRTVEDKLEAESRRQSEAMVDLREQRDAARAAAQAYEKRAAALERELEDERQRRQELEETFAALGFDDMTASANNLQGAVEALARFLEGVNAYQARQQEREQQRLRLKEAAELERQAATQAGIAQQQAELAWATRERDRFEERESTLFPNGQIDHIIIDGHNLVHRTHRPEDESRTRPWLEDVVEQMARRLEERGWASRVHLVFDTQHGANTFTRGHGLTVYFANRDEGGADARIAELLREGNPQAHYMVVSTDRKHVWSDALEFIESAGSEVDLVQVEMLAQYLQALDEGE